MPPDLLHISITFAVILGCRSIPSKNPSNCNLTRFRCSTLALSYAQSCLNRESPLQHPEKPLIYVFILFLQVLSSAICSFVVSEGLRYSACNLETKAVCFAAVAFRETFFTSNISPSNSSSSSIACQAE